MKRVEAVIFDWAGTTVDHGSLAPVRAVTAMFARHGIHVSDSDARRDMGLFKKDHIRRILAMGYVEAAWKASHSAPPTENDVEALFAEFATMQMDILEEYSGMIGGAPAAAGRLRSRGIKIGSTTGYTRPMLDRLLIHSAAEGYAPDLSLCPDDLGGGRPYPWMCLRIAIEFRLTSTAAAVKVGDTVSDIQEGLNAGMWTVGVSLTGNEVGMSAADVAALTDEERTRRAKTAGNTLRNAGAHYVVESVADLDPVLASIGERLAAGERP
ncbi:MAG TPA: phosphonoacetaldehyde hydrolase [Bryobacteraceae bacterium]|nr:phosphonoacetaldehyde hydrolase [Bryobacteraceae bacterium]